MKKCTYAALSAVMIIMLCGCESLFTDGKKRERQIQSLENKITETGRYSEDQVNRLTGQVRNLQDLNVELKQKIDLQGKQIDTLNRRLIQQENNIKTLANNLAEEQKVRQTAINKLADESAREITRVADAVSRGRKTSTGPATSGEFYEYKVQPGATLSTIASAYKVNIEEIRKANKLKNDSIFVGQKLYIPKK